MKSTKRLLGLYAHPDDEILAPSSTLAKYAANGVQIEWVVATRGEAGEIADPSLATPENLGQVREQEMDCAAKTIGIQKLHFLGYRDSGMDGTEENQHPNAYMNSNLADVLPRLVKIIRQFRPHVILTFEPYGGYGHPDHITIHKHALAAFDAAGDETYHPDLGKPWQTPRLFYPLLRTAVFQAMADKMAAKGLNTDFLEWRKEHQKKGWPDDNYHCRINVRDTLSQKWAAFRCHATQFGAHNLFRQLSEAELADIFTHEYFALACPKPPSALILLDLFDDII